MTEARGCPVCEAGGYAGCSACSPCQPPAAPCADEVEVVARAIFQCGLPHTTWGEVSGIYASAALAALSPLRQAERERAWREGAEAMREACVKLCHARAKEIVDLLLSGIPEEARRRESMEAAITRMAYAIMHSPLPLPQPQHEPKPDAQWLAGAEAIRSALAAFVGACGARALAEAMRAFPLPPMGGSK